MKRNFTASHHEERYFYSYILSFFRVSNILYTQIEIDELESEFVEEMKKMEEYFS